MRGLLAYIDLVLFIPALILVIVGLTTLFSLSPSLFRSQLFYLFISLIAFYISAHVHHKVAELFATPIYIVSVILLIIVLLIGFESRGAVRWVNFFGLQIQFSEILKPFLLISGASYLSKSRKTSKALFKSLLFMLPVVFLIYKQPDLGNALIYFIVMLLTLATVGFPLMWFGAGIAFLVVTFPLTWRFLHEYQRQRILTFLQLKSDPLGTSYNAIQSIIAVGSGSWFGKGIGNATQSGLRFLPERHTDFIFATISEAFGFMGALLIIVTFAFLLYRIYAIYTSLDDSFSKTLTALSFFLLLVQCFVSIGMNIGIVPIVGITLPFVSYGGSSLLSNFILLGFLSSLGKSAKTENILEIR